MSRRPARTPADPHSDEAVLAAPEDRAAGHPTRYWLVHLGVPLGVSVALHALLLFGASFYTFAVRQGGRAEVGEYEAGVVEADQVSVAEAFRWNEDVSLEAPTVEPLEDISSLTDFGRVEPLDERALDAGVTKGGLAELDDEGRLGLGSGRFSLLGTGGGAGEAGSGGFGAGGLGGRQRVGYAGIWDVRVRASAVVYVVDFSGSIIVAVDDLKRELKRSVGRLAPAQTFNVIVFYSESGSGRERYQAEAFQPELVPANESMRMAFFDWLAEKTPKGRTEPLGGMRRALALRPDTVFFFSDGLFDEDVVEEIRLANANVQAKIICLVFDEILLQDMSGLPRETDGARRLRRIAEQNRGRLKIVTGADL